MSTEGNKAIVRRYQELHNTSNLEALDEIVAPGVHTPDILPGMPPGLEGAKQVHRLTLLGMPDFHAVIDDLIAEGDKVAARITMTGTHTGDFMGLPPTHRRVRFTGMYLVRIVDGKIVEHQGVEDGVSLLQQLGALPGPSSS